jgi:hypothetical protein
MDKVVKLVLSKDSKMIEIDIKKNKTAFQLWFETLLEEKQLPDERWGILVDGEMNFIDSDVVIEAIKNAPTREQEKIKDIIVGLDFKTAPIMPFFKYLAEAMIKVRLEN